MSRFSEEVMDRLPERVAREIAEIEEEAEQMSAHEEFNLGEIDRLETRVAQIEIDIRVAIRIARRGVKDHADAVLLATLFERYPEVKS